MIHPAKNDQPVVNLVVVWLPPAGSSLLHGREETLDRTFMATT